MLRLAVCTAWLLLCAAASASASPAAAAACREACSRGLQACAVCQPYYSELLMEQNDGGDSDGGDTSRWVDDDDDPMEKRGEHGGGMTNVFRWGKRGDWGDDGKQDTLGLDGGVDMKRNNVFRWGKRFAESMSPQPVESKREAADYAKVFRWGKRSDGLPTRSVFRWGKRADHHSSKGYVNGEEDVNSEANDAVPNVSALRAYSDVLQELANLRSLQADKHSFVGSSRWKRDNEDAVEKPSMRWLLRQARDGPKRNIFRWGKRAEEV